MSQDVTIKELINQLQGEISSAVHDLGAISAFSKKLPQCHAENLDREFIRISDLFEEVERKVKRASSQISQGNEKWGNGSFSNITSSSKMEGFTPVLSSSQINTSTPTTIHFTRGDRKDYLDRHYWDSQDWEGIGEYRESLKPQKKSFISQTLGESWGHNYVTDILGYKEVFHGDSKSIRQGLDGIYLDPEKDALVIAEFKGQNSPESTAQRRYSWTLDTCQKIQRSQFPYDNVSEFERQAALFILQEYDAGRIIRYEVIRTEVDPKTGKIWTQLEKRTHLEHDNSPP